MKPPEVGLRKKYFSARSNADELHELIEPLNLMPTKIEEKREKLHRMYARKEKKRVGMSTRVLFSSAEKWVFVFSSLVVGSHQVKFWKNCLNHVVIGNLNLPIFWKQFLFHQLF